MEFSNADGRPRQRCPGLAFTQGVWKGCWAVICMQGHLHTHIFPGLGALFGGGKHVASFATFLLKCHGIIREKVYVDSIGDHV